MSKELCGYVERFSSLRIAVVGDFIADEYIHGNTSRISREAPVIVLNFSSREIIPGGGGNATMNAAALGGKVFAVGVRGEDPIGANLSGIMKERGVDTGFLFSGSGRTTPTKTRVMAGGRNTSRQQVIRVDNEPAAPISGALEAKISGAMEGLCRDGLDAVILSDYGLGVVGPGVRQGAEAWAKTCIVNVDSRHAADAFRGVTAITPNEEEVEELLGYWPNEERLGEAGALLLERTGTRGVLITRGKKGMSLFENGGGRRDLPIFGTDEVADVTGAGDTVIAAFTLALAAGAAMPEAAEIANCAAGLVVMKAGTAVVERDELLGALSDKPA